MSEVIKSVSYDQDEILNSIIKLYCKDGFECDISYGNGGFYKNIKRPDLKFDIDPQLDDVKEATSTKLPLNDNSLNNIVFDPPFLTYVRAARDGNGSMVMAKRFSGYWAYSELEEHYKGTLKEAARVLKKKGVMVFKCQDIIHNHKMHATHINVVNWAQEFNMRVKDMFILPVKNRMPSPNRAGKQKHARIYHSYFLVLEKTK